MAASKSGNNPTRGPIWAKKLDKIPKVSAITISKHLEKCGKQNVGEKGYKFYTENYINSVYTMEDRDGVHVKGLCHRSQRKNEPPHKIQIKVVNSNGTGVTGDCSCSCKAGIGGHCNHVFALLFLLNHWSMLGIKDIPADLTCTSLEQEWHKPRGATIKPEPLMKCSFVNSATDQDGTRNRDPVTPKLYDARGKRIKIDGWRQESVMEMCQYLSSEEKRAPFSYLLEDQEYSESINTVFGNVPLGSPLSYQLTDLNENQTVFNVYRPITCILPENHYLKDIKTFPDLPITTGMSQAFIPPQGFSLTDPVLKSISLTTEQSWSLQKNTVCQAEDALWFQEKKFRLTASNFGRVLFRIQKPSEPFFNSIFIPKDLSNVPSISHGKRNEGVVRSLYSRKMQKQVHRKLMVYNSGLNVNPALPYLGATPDGKVFDPTCTSPFGLLEIKCPYSFRNEPSIERACENPSFPCEMVDGVPKLKKEHKQGYYQQVQGQLAISGLDWCDFVIYLAGSRAVSVERIFFDQHYWDDVLFPKLTSFYFDHAILFLKNTYFA